MRNRLETAPTIVRGRRKARAKPWWLVISKHLGCGKYSWTGWAVVCIFILFSAITVRLLVRHKARQQLQSRTAPEEVFIPGSDMNETSSSTGPAREGLQVGEGQALSYLVAGDTTSDYMFLLVHGASREFQNAGHWAPHMDFFARLGRVYAVDMLGHGQATPGPSDSQAVAAETQVHALRKLVADKKEPHQKLVLVGRSYGGRIVLELANMLHPDVHRIVLIAPALQESLMGQLSKEVLSVPTLVFWAGDDTTVPYAKKKDLLDYLPAKEVVLFDSVVSEGRQAWEAHTPELIRVVEFQSKLQAWLLS